MKKLSARAAALVAALALSLAITPYSAYAGYGANAYQATGAYCQKNVPAAAGAGWFILGFRTGGYNIGEKYYKDYLAAETEHVKSVEGVLSSRKYTDYSATVIGVTAAGGDASDIGGYDIIAPLTDTAAVAKQGINGPIYALLALDYSGYSSPAADVARQSYIDTILSRRFSDGGWAFSGDKSDPDVTAMALQALAPYRTGGDGILSGDNSGAVDAAVDTALAFLSSSQRADGGFASWGTANAESCAQVLTALARLGIPSGDARFTKNGKTALDAMLSFSCGGGAFSHTAGGEPNMIATAQCFIALAELRKSEDSDWPMTREAAAKALYESAGSQPLSADAGQSAFSDTRSVAAVWANDAGLMLGTGSGRFSPRGAVTRETFAAVLLRLAADEGRDTSARTDRSFSDASDISGWAAEAVSWCAAEGYFVGTPDGRFLPKTVITRGQLESVLGRFYK